MITELNEKILADLEEEEIEVEIPESDEYNFNLEFNIQHVKRLIETRTSCLNVHDTSYLSDQNLAAFNSTSTNTQPVTPQHPLLRNLVSSENVSQVHAQENDAHVSIDLKFHLPQITKARSSRL